MILRYSRLQTAWKINNNTMKNSIVFDFEITFTHAGTLQGKEFRMGLIQENTLDSELKVKLIAQLQLQEVAEVIISNKYFIQELDHVDHEKQTFVPVEFIDLSHDIFDELITYKGLPAPIICDYISRDKSKEFYALGTEFQIGKIEMVTNTGTYIDCPFHRYADGKDLSEIELTALTNINAITIHALDEQEIGIAYFLHKDLQDKAVLVHTGWSKYWNTETYFENHPYLTEEAALYLRDAGVKLVGIDSHNIDDTRGNKRPVHTTLLAADILIVEHLCQLDQLPDVPFLFSAIPPKIKNVGTFPVRAFATIIYPATTEITPTVVGKAIKTVTPLDLEYEKNHFVFRMPIDMRWSDMDELHHVNNAIYLTYFEQARLHYFQDAMEWDWKKMGVILASAHLDYFQPLVFPNPSYIFIRTSKVGNKSLLLEYMITSVIDGEERVATKGTTTMVVFDYLTNKSTAVPEYLKERLAQYECTPITF
jgi:arylformamidase